MPETVTLEFLAARVAALTDDMRDVQLRLGGIEARFAGLEQRFSAFVSMTEAHFASVERRLDLIEERTNRMLSILVRIAERVAPGTASGSAADPG